MTKCPKCESKFKSQSSLGSHIGIHPRTEEDKQAMRRAWVDVQEGRRTKTSVLSEFRVGYKVLEAIVDEQSPAVNEEPTVVADLPEPAPPLADRTEFTPQDYVQAFMDYTIGLKRELDVQAVEIGRLQEEVQRGKQAYTALASQVNAAVFRQKNWHEQLAAMRDLVQKR